MASIKENQWLYNRPLIRPYFWGGMLGGWLTSRDGEVKGVLNGGRLDCFFANTWHFRYISQRITRDDFYMYPHEWLIYDNKCREI